MNKQLNELFEFLRFPSVSADRKYAQDVRACAGWLSNKLREMGLAVRQHETPGNPIVVAKSPQVEGKRTVLIYGHYDVQPVDPLNLWHSSPFEPEVRSGRIWARGVTDNKGQMFAHVCGLEQALQEELELPVNVICVFEGEEEVGSGNLIPFIKEHIAELKCDVIVISDTGMVAPGVPTFTYGLRGIAACEVRVKGAKMDLHSGTFGGAIANPLTALARLLATLHTADGKVAVAGFYDAVLGSAAHEREEWQSLLKMHEDYFLQSAGVPHLWGESGYNTVERLWTRPTLELNGIGGGYQGEGSKTVLPAEAFAKITCRLVPNQTPEDVAAKVRKHLLDHCPPGVRIEIDAGHGCKPYLADPNSYFGKAAQTALRKAFGAEPVRIREGGSVPIVQEFKDVLGADSLLLGLALPDANIHAPNENLPIENFMAGMKLNRELLRELAK